MNCTIIKKDGREEPLEQNVAPYGEGFNKVDLPFVRQGIHWYEVRYAYHDGQGARPALGDYGPRREAKKRVEAWSAADAVVQVAIYVDSLYASSRCKILEVSPVTK